MGKLPLLMLLVSVFLTSTLAANNKINSVDGVNDGPCFYKCMMAGGSIQKCQGLCSKPVDEDCQYHCLNEVGDYVKCLELCTDSVTVTKSLKNAIPGMESEKRGDDHNQMNKLDDIDFTCFYRCTDARIPQDVCRGWCSNSLTVTKSLKTGISRKYSEKRDGDHNQINKLDDIDFTCFYRCTDARIPQDICRGWCSNSLTVTKSLKTGIPGKDSKKRDDDHILLMSV